MTTAIALARSDVPDTMAEMMQVANFLQHSTMLPLHLQGEPSSLFAVMLKARALNIPMATAFDNIIVQDGKTGLTTTLMQALVIRAGYNLFLAHQDDQSATVRAVREGIGPEQEGVALVSFSLADAVKAKLITLENGKVVAKSKAGNSMSWEKYTRDMLVWRAVSRACKYYFPDVLMGMIYTPDELGAEVDDEGRIVRVNSIRVDTLTDDMKTAMLRINRATSTAELRALYDEFHTAGLLSELVPDGHTLSQYLAAKKSEVVQAEKAKAAEAAKNPAPAEPAADTDEPAPAEPEPAAEDPAPVVEPPVDADPAEPVISDPAPENTESGFDALTVDEPEPAPVADADTEDNPRRKAVLKLAGDHFGDADNAETAAVQQFGRPIDTIGTPQLQEWLMTVRKADH